MPNTAIHTVYKTLDGKRVPSVTTYLGVLNKPALVHWAWELGVAGLDYRKVRDQAGDTGTIVHYLILSQLRGEEPDYGQWSEHELNSALSPMSKFEAWKNEHELEPILLEAPLVSEVYRYGGTPDFYGKVDGKLTLLDFKTSKAIYKENFYQLAAYKELLEEHRHGVEAVKVLRIGKSDDEGFEERAAGDLENHWQVFLACQSIYELEKVIGRSR